MGRRRRTRSRLESRCWILVRIRVRGPRPRAGPSARTRDRDQQGRESFLPSRGPSTIILQCHGRLVPAFIFLTQTRALPPGPGRRPAAVRAGRRHESYAPAAPRARGRPGRRAGDNRHRHRRGPGGNSSCRDRQSDSDPLFSSRQCAVITVVMMIRVRMIIVSD